VATEFHVLGVDPGLLTGVALARFTVPKGCELLESHELEFNDLLDYFTAKIPEASHLVIERFIINQRTVSNSQAPWSLEATGVARAVALQNDMKVNMQSAADGKSAVDNQMLRRLDLWHRGGEGHANDAIRHTVAFMIRRGWRDPRMLPSG
jgi:hypothetical protein